MLQHIRKLNLPNQLTLARIVGVPLIVVVTYQNTPFTGLMAGVLFALAAFTDLVDGYLARRCNQVTRLGKILDPLADKVLVCCILILLVDMQRIAGWLAMLMICRDVLVTGLRAVGSQENIPVPVDTYGKVKTVLQLLGLAPMIVYYPWLGVPFAAIGEFLLYIALLLTVFSGLNYFHTFYLHWRNKDAARKNGG